MDKPRHLWITGRRPQDTAVVRAAPPGSGTLTWSAWRSSSVRQSKRLIIAVSPVQVRPPLPILLHPLSSRRERHSTVAATDVRPKITLACQECKHRNYITKKNRRNDPDRLELKKYCPNCRCHRPHRETR